jgi:protein-tyrosine-phosphatase
MVDMSGEPSDKDIAKAEKELGIDIPKVKKPSKLSAEEKDKFDIALKGITAKVNRIKNREAKPDDLTLLKKAYGDEGIKKLFKKAGENLDDLVAGIIGGGDTGADLIPDELT